MADNQQPVVRSRVPPVLLGCPQNQQQLLPTLLYIVARVIAALREWSKVDAKLLATLRLTQPAAWRFGWRRKTRLVLERGQRERMAALNGQVAGRRVDSINLDTERQSQNNGKKKGLVIKPRQVIIQPSSVHKSEARSAHVRPRNGGSLFMPKRPIGDRTI